MTTPHGDCDKVHVSEATFQRLIREREEALVEVQVIDAENERLRATCEEEARKARERAIEEAAKVCDDFAKCNCHTFGDEALNVVADVAANIRALKAKPPALPDIPSTFVIVTRKEWEALKKKGGK
jgi:regulator of protease activity HflC (stomatin/prohibitin superfamily)